jgi:large subunit ribosomal protein L21
MYAIIKTGGKQYRVEKGDEIYVEKLLVDDDGSVEFRDVLAIGDEGKVKVGTPYVSGAKVTADVVKNGKGKKLNILTYRSKKGSARRVGHRQPYTKVRITGIAAK